MLLLRLLCQLLSALLPADRLMVVEAVELHCGGVKLAAGLGRESGFMDHLHNDPVSATEWKVQRSSGNLLLIN